MKKHLALITALIVVPPMAFAGILNFSIPPGPPTCHMTYTEGGANIDWKPGYKFALWTLTLGTNTVSWAFYNNGALVASGFKTCPGGTQESNFGGEYVGTELVITKCSPGTGGGPVSNC